MENRSGYQEIEHTADWELLVWGPDLTSLMETAAKGMYALSDTKLAADPRLVRHFEIPFVDRESLLVDFLAELLFFGEDEGIAFDDFEFKIYTDILNVQAKGAPITNQSKEIKAVTYHALQIQETDQGLQVRIVFDV